MNIKKTINKNVPKWLTDYFDRSIEYQEEIFDVSIKTYNALKSVNDFEQTVELLFERLEKFASKNITDTYLEKKAKALKLITTKNKDAQFILDKKSNILESQQIVLAWSALENFVRDLVVCFISHNKSILLKEPFSSIKVKLVEYDELYGNDRYSYLVRRAEADKGLSNKMGVNKFENILSLIGIDDAVPKVISELIYETQQVRNITVHNYLVADKRFCSACPNFGAKLGKRIEITSAHTGVYSVAILLYYSLIFERLVCLYGEGNTSNSIEYFNRSTKKELNKLISDVKKIKKRKKNISKTKKRRTKRPKKTKASAIKKQK